MTSSGLASLNQRGTDSLGALPPLLVDAFSTKSVLNAKGELIPLHSNVSKDEALQLYSAVRRVQPAASVEIGFAQGISATAILQACAHNGQGSHHVMDPFQANFEDAGLAMVSRTGLESWLTFHRKFAEEVLPQLPRIQFGFIDASHLFDLSLQEFVLIDKKLDIGGVIAVHDMWMPSLQKMLRYILTNRAYEIARELSPEAGPVRLTSKTISRILKMIPCSERLFKPEVLNPWSTLGVPNLVFLRKTANDQRDWQVHSSF
jgi:predicted O-methyltransferase YrrM